MPATDDGAGRHAPRHVHTQEILDRSIQTTFASRRVGAHMATMFSVHRCRFVNYTPSAITAIGFPPLPLPPLKGKGKIIDARIYDFGILALGRANGNIELHEWTGVGNRAQAPQAWVLQKVLPGPVPSKVESLVLTARTKYSNPSSFGRLQPASLRLFSAGGGSEILEWNLEEGTLLRSASSQAGTVWSMAANPASTLLALGCEDGSVRILSLVDDTMTHHRRLDRVKSRLLSIAWGPPTRRRSSRTVTQARPVDSSSEDEETEEWVDTWIAVGCSDSSLRKFDVASGRVLDRMSTDKLRGERTLVWAVGVLGDGTIVSGDSLGTVKFWDSTTCTQLQSFQAHNADVLCLTIGPEGRSVYTSGVDQKVCQFSNVQVSTATEGPLSATSRNRWICSSFRRLHSHDVRALAVWPPHTPLAVSQRSAISSQRMAPVLVSGGLDMSLVICPCSLPSAASQKVINPIASSSVTTFEDGYHCRVPYSTGMSPAVQVAREVRILSCRRDTGLTLWKISKSASPREIGLLDLDVENFDNQQEDNWEKVADIELKVRTNLVASAISSDGRWVAASDLYETKLLRLVHVKDEIRPRRVKLPEETTTVAAGATSLLFTADSSRLVVGASMGKPLVVIVDLTGEGPSSPRVLRRFDHHRTQNVMVGGNHTKSAKNMSSMSEADAEASDDTDGTDAEAVRPQARYQTESSVAASITCMAASLDGQWLASADTRHRIHVFNLDSVQHHCALPSFPHAIAALAFDPVAPSKLVVGLANNTLQVFDVEARQFPSSYRSLLGPHLAELHDPLLGIAFDPAPTASSHPRRALLWGSSWMCNVNFAMTAGPSGSSKKRRRENNIQSSASAEGHDATQAAEDVKSRIVSRYRPMLLVDFVGPSELVVVERPLVDLLSELPPAFFKHRYGT